MAPTADSKISLMIGTLAFQLQIVTMALEQKFSSGTSSQGQTVQAFMIIALLLLVTAEVLLAEITFAEVKLTVACICAIIMLWVAALCILVALVVFGTAYQQVKGSVPVASVPYDYTTYVIASAAAIVAGVFVIRVMKAKG